MSEQTLEMLASIRRRLRATGRRTTLADLAYGTLVALAALTSAWLISAAAEALLWLDPAPRTVLAVMLALIAVVLLGYYVGRPLLRLAGLLDGPSEEDVARRVGRHYPEVADRLVNLLHLSEGRGSHSPNTLVDGAVRSLGEDVQRVSFEDVEDFARARRASRYAAAPVLVVLIALLAAPSGFLGATQRLLTPGEQFARPMPFTLHIEPGAASLVRGDSLKVRVQAEGQQLPRSLTLQFSNEGEEHVEQVTLTPGGDGIFTHTLVNVRTPLRYRAQASPVTSDWYPVELTDRPVLRDLRVTLDFPDYTGMPDQRLAPNVGDVTALPGTRVQLQAGLGGPSANDALLVFDDGRRDTLSVDDMRAEGTFTLDHEGSYHLRLRSADGVTNRDPISYSLKLLRDEPPSIVLLRPQETVALDESMQTPLRVRLSDDFGFVGLRLYYRLSKSRFKEAMDEYEAIELPLQSPRQLDQELAYEWLLKETTPLRLAPGDVIDYFVRVWDNDAVAGYKTAQTPVQQLTLPSLAEQYEQLDRQQDETEEQLEEMTRQTESMREQFEELRDELRRKPEADWEDERQVERLKERQQQMQQQADQVTRQLEEMTREMKRNDLVNEETMQLYEELQRVADEVNSPELEKALKQLQEAMQNMDPQQMQQALEDYEFNEQQYQQRLERTLELFKKVRMQQQLSEMERRAEELARQEEELAEQTKQLRREQGEQPDEQDRADSERQDGEQHGGEKQDGESPEDEHQDTESENGQNQQGESQQGQQKQQGENQQGQQNEQSPQGEQGAQQQNQRDQASHEERKRLAEQQERASEEMKALEEKMRELREQMDEMKSGPKQQMQQLEQQMQQQQLSRQMQQNSQQLQQNQLQEAQQGQQQMQQQLQQMQQQMQQMQKGMQGQQMQINLAAMRRVLTDVLTLSEQQEALRLRVQDIDSDSPTLREFTRRQSELSDGLSVVSDTLQHLAKEIPQMRREVQREAGESLREMSGATDAMTERQSGRATSHQKASMMHLNELALMLSELLGQMQQQSGGGGGMSMQQMMQQMQQMGQQQEGLNQQIQQMLNDAQGNRLSNDQQQRLQQMARQQQAIKRQLEELSRSRHAKGNVLGDLQRIAEQMQETIREMQQRQLDRRTVERQQQILTRLLDAQKSLRTQGREDRREGQSGRDYDRERPGELTPPEEAERLRRALIRAIESGYAPDYEELIKRYFDLLQQQQDEAPVLKE